MDVAITGASGFIGSALTAELTRRGHRVIPMVRRPVKPGEEAIWWDPDSGTVDRAALEGIDAVIHLAAENIGRRRWTKAQKDRLVASRTKGTALVAETLASLKQRPKVFISASAIGYYGDRGDEVLTESSAPGDDFLADLCVQWEHSTHAAAEAGIRTITIRTGLVLDAKEGALGRQLLLFKLGLGGRIGSGEQWQSWISLPDHLGAICHLLEADAGPAASIEGPVNLTAPNPVTNLEFTKTLGRVLRRPTVIPIPVFAPAILYGRELVEALLMSSQRVLPDVLSQSGYEFTHPHFEAAVRATLDRPKTPGISEPSVTTERRVSVSRFIPASPEAIFALLADASQHSRFDGSGTVTGTRDPEPEPLSLGARFGMRMKMGIPYTITNELVEFEPDRRIAWRHWGHHIWRYELEPVEGGTEVTETFDWSQARWPKGIELVGYPRRHPPAMERTLERLEALVT